MKHKSKPLAGADDRVDRRALRGRRVLLATALSMVIAAGAVVPAYAMSGTPKVTVACGGMVGVAKLTPAMGDQTQIGVSWKGALGKNLSLPKSPPIGGSCTGGGITRPGDPHTPIPPGTLTPKAVTMSLLGNTSCASGATAEGVDATRLLAHYPANGKFSLTMNETYIDLISGLTKHYSAQAYLTVTGFDPAGPDVLDFEGIVTKGVMAGGIVSGSMWEVPVVKLRGRPGAPG